MKTFVIVSCLVALGYARPEAGYAYNGPAAGGGFGGGGGGGGFAGGFSSGAVGGAGHGLGGGVGVGGFSGGHGGGGHSSGGFSAGGHGGSGGFGGGGAGGFGTGGFGAGGLGGGVSGGYSGGQGGGGAGGYNYEPQTQTVHKHIYVHVPPPEPEEHHAPRQIPVGKSQKHYKIIFIKAPSHQSYQQQIIPQIAQNEEKTLIYVLSKKAEGAQDIVIPTAAPTPPSKPEVYFIKYNTRKEQSAGGYASSGQPEASGAAFGGSGSGGDAIGSGPGLDVRTSGGSIGGGAIGGGDIGGGSVGHSAGAVAPSANYGPPGKSGPY